MYSDGISSSDERIQTFGFISGNIVIYGLCGRETYTMEVYDSEIGTTIASFDIAVRRKESSLDGENSTIYVHSTKGLNLFLELLSTSKLIDGDRVREKVAIDYEIQLGGELIIDEFTKELLRFVRTSFAKYDSRIQKHIWEKNNY